MDYKKLKESSEKFKDKLLKLKVCLFDIDGILTDGHVFHDGSEVGWNRVFHTRDGYGLKLLREAGLKVGVISGGDSNSVRQRFIENLGLDYVHLGNEDKRKAYLSVTSDGYKDEEVLYMGDEFFDLPLLKRAGFSATVPAASPEVQASVDYVTQLDSGKGCAREVIEMIRFVRNFTPDIPDFED
ncbi:MAG: KdsC family phosphatase [Bacteriovoracaceae bacterium]